MNCASLSGCASSTIVMLVALAEAAEASVASSAMPQQSISRRVSLVISRLLYEHVVARDVLTLRDVDVVRRRAVRAGGRRLEGVARRHRRLDLIARAGLHEDRVVGVGAAR